MASFTPILIFYFTCFLLSTSCQARQVSQPSSNTKGHGFWVSNEPELPTDGLHTYADRSPIEQPPLGLDIAKRDRSTRPPRPNPTKISTNATTVRIFGMDLIYTDKEFQIVRSFWRKIPELVALMIVGIEVEPQHNLHFRLGALNLNLYALTEALTQSVVLAVANRLAEMATRGVICLGLGEVVVGAGIRVLFAAGIRLPGFQDINGGFAELRALIG